MKAALEQRIEGLTNSAPVEMRSLSGGCVAEVYRAVLADGESVVVKVDQGARPNLDIEASMLRYLRRHSDLCVPAVIGGEPDLLVMEFVDHDGRRGPDVEIEAADALAALHNVEGPHYGFDEDTLIGGLNLPNPSSDDWSRFFAEHRLRAFARRCVEAGMLDRGTADRIEALCQNMDQWLDDPQPPALIHGDIWGGNVLVDDGHLAALIDPAIYFADPEIELAFIDLFNTFGDRFYARYGEYRPIAPGFFERRKELYNLFPLLVHVRLFGGTYVASVRAVLDRFGV